MGSNRITFKKAVITLTIFIGAGLIYAVYFTELGEPPSSEGEKQITTYNNQLAIPTYFVEASQAPSVNLNWAYANKEMLKFAVSIHGLTADANSIADIICNPYIRTEDLVRQRISGYEIRSIYDAGGQAIEIIYEYEISANANLLNIEMDITIGPCADYLNFQETNVTPSSIPDLIGNYHLSFQVPVQ